MKRDSSSRKKTLKEVVKPVEEEDNSSDSPEEKLPLPPPKKTAAASKEKKRVRNDTFSKMTHQEICDRVDTIIDGNHETYKVNKNCQTKKDANSQNQSCWRVERKSDSEGVKNLYSADAYRSFFVWGTHKKAKAATDPESAAKLIAQLDLVKRDGDAKHHHAHRCGYGSCVNPDHIRIESRAENEVDKHYHFFLNGSKRDQFISLYKDELIKRNIW